MKRDFTYIDDIIQGTIRAIDLGAKCEVFNLGNNNSEHLSSLIENIEKNLNKKAQIELKPMQPGDVYETYADILKKSTSFGLQPSCNP